MDDNELKLILIKKGMKELDIDRLIRAARQKKTSISWQFFWSLSGLYWYSFFIIIAYFFFTHRMSEKELMLFNVIYFSLLFMLFFLTPFFKKFLWSVHILLALRGR